MAVEMSAANILLILARHGVDIDLQDANRMAETFMEMHLGSMNDTFGRGEARGRDLGISERIAQETEEKRTATYYMNAHRLAESYDWAAEYFDADVILDTTKKVENVKKIQEACPSLSLAEAFNIWHALYNVYSH